MLRMLERAGYGRRIHDIKHRIPAWFRGRNAWFFAAACALPLVYPWCARTTCPVVMEPIAHRLVAAPYEGVFDTSQVMPGDRVEAGQVLGRMDGRELRAKLAACEADLKRAGKSRDVNLAAGKLAGAQIDRLEMERLQHERELLVRRLEQLEIRSPIAGIVVTGDLRRYESATVKVGQSLYEIAPLDRLTAEVAIPEEDLEQVFPGADVSIRLDAVSRGPLEGRIERMRPRGELRDNKQVFVAEVELVNVDENLRPGMKGSATVIGPRAPGIWLLLRKPWHATLRFVGW
jgi:RND family efflux transporter MFP subunit